MTLSVLLPAWLIALTAYLAAVLILLRLRAERRRTRALALFPALVWLGTVYLFVQFNLFGLGNADLRAAAVRPALMLMLMAFFVSDLAALWRLRRSK